MWHPGLNPRKSRFPTNNDEFHKLEGFIEEADAKHQMYRFMRMNPTFAVDLLFGVRLYPFQHMLIKSVFEADYCLFVLSRGQSKCPGVNELCMTDRGMITMGNVKIGDLIQSKDGQNRVLGKIINEKQKIYNVRTRHGYNTGGLDYHRYYALNKNMELEWKYAKGTQVGDTAIIKKGFQFFPEQSDIFEGIQTEYNLRGASTEDWYYYFGLLLGDGHIGQCRAVITSQDPETHEWMRNFASKIGVKLVEAARGNGTLDLTLQTRDFIDVLMSFGFNRKNAHEKTIPSKLLLCSQKNACALLRGLMDTDGYSSTTERKYKNAISTKVGYTSSSPRLMDQVQNLLLNIGIISTRYTCFHGGDMKFGGKVYDCRPSESLNITGQSNLTVFDREIGFNLHRKASKVKDFLARNIRYDKSDLEDYIPGLGDYIRNKYKCKSVVRPKIKFKVAICKNISKNKLAALLKVDFFDSEDKDKLSKLLDRTLYFDPVVKVSEGQGITVDITVEKEHCFYSNGFISHNSWTTAIAIMLYACLNQGVKIGLLAASFRGSRLLFDKMEDILAKPQAALGAACLTDKKRAPDMYVYHFGASQIIALPLGDGQKLRGFRFQLIVIDEFLLMPATIYNEVILPFLGVVENPTEREDRRKLEDDLVKRGLIKDEDRYQWPANKLVMLSSASYKFEYLYELYCKFEKLIMEGLERDESGNWTQSTDKASRCIFHLSYDVSPPDLYDENLLAQAKSTMSSSQFNKEFNSIFLDESDGYFKLSTMEKRCTLREGQYTEIKGEPGFEYILSLDPSWSESEASDDFAIQILKMMPDSGHAVVVHSFAVCGQNLKTYINYFYYLLTNFNICLIVMDYMGGLQFMNAAKESDKFVNAEIKLETIDVDFDDPEAYVKDIEKFRREYNKSSGKMVLMRKPTSKWIREANELLQANFDHARILFAAVPDDEEFKKQISQVVDIEHIVFDSKKSKDMELQAKKIDLIEIQHDNIEMTKTQCAMIQMTTTDLGTATFGLPSNLKGIKGPNKPRKDSYSALVLGSWGVKIFIDKSSKKIAHGASTFTPMMIRGR